MVEEAYLKVDFGVQQEGDNLKSIEIFGVPTEQLENGQVVVSEKVHSFLEMFIAKEMFEANRTLSKYSFESLKIWLYDTSKAREEQGFSLPSREQEAIVFSSNLPESELKYISVIDIGLTGNPKVLWEKACDELLTILFKRFVSPPDPPDVLKEFMLMRFGEQLTNKLDLYLSMRKNMCFDALIVQAK